jgi:hypothetical protein
LFWETGNFFEISENESELTRLPSEFVELQIFKNQEKRKGKESPPFDEELMSKNLLSHNLNNYIHILDHIAVVPKEAAQEEVEKLDQSIKSFSVTPVLKTSGYPHHYHLTINVE